MGEFLFAINICANPFNIEWVGLNTEVNYCYCESVHISGNNESMVLATLVSLSLPLLKVFITAFLKKINEQFVKKGVFNDLRVALHTLFNMGLKLVRVLHDCIYVLSYKWQKQKETIRVKIGLYLKDTILEERAYLLYVNLPEYEKHYEKCKLDSFM